MAKFRNDNLDLETGEHIDFDDADTVQMGYDGTELYINSTVSGVRAAQPHHMVRYDQLTEVSGVLSSAIIDEFVGLIDTPTTYSGYSNYTVIVSDDESGLEFIAAAPGAIVSGTSPPASGTSNIWYNSNDNVIYYWDSARDDWLSSSIINYLFTYSGNIDGLYMSVGNVVNSYAHFNITRPATITALTADQDPIGSTQADKGYEVRNGGATMYSFSMVSHTYSNSNLNVAVSSGTSLQMFTVSAGAKVRDPIVNLELRWRYEE